MKLVRQVASDCLPSLAALQVNLLWAECPHLGSGLVRELEAKVQIVRRLAAEGKRGRTRFISAEGCYSWVVANTPEMRVKFASKAFADWSDDREFYVVDGAVRKCPDPSSVWQPTATGDRAGTNGSCNPFGPRVAPPSTRMGGLQRPLGPRRPVSLHAECSRWVEERYRLCGDLTEEESPLYNVMLANGSWSASRFSTTEPANSLEGAFLHLQRWKGEYKRLSYGEKGMPHLKGRRVFKLSRFGVMPLDVEYDPERGINASSLSQVVVERDITEMDDDEFERQLKSSSRADANAHQWRRRPHGHGAERQ